MGKSVLVEFTVGDDGLKVGGIGMTEVRVCVYGGFKSRCILVGKVMMVAALRAYCWGWSSSWV